MPHSHEKALFAKTGNADEPPMPARIEPKQALHLAEALAKGTPDPGRIALTILADKVWELI